MGDFEVQQYVPTIDAVLKVSDLKELTVKKIRKALEALFGTDFGQNKHAINEIITERYYKFSGQADEDEGFVTEQDKLKLKIKELEKENRQLSAKLNQSLSSGKIRSATSKRKKKKADGPPKETPFSKKLTISDTLATFLGSSDPISRPETVKRLWQYIKANDLQNPDDKREILCDDKMKPLFGDRINMFKMNKELSSHFGEPATSGDAESGTKEEPAAPLETLATPSKPEPAAGTSLDNE